MLNSSKLKTLNESGIGITTLEYIKMEVKEKSFKESFKKSDLLRLFFPYLFILR